MVQLRRFLSYLEVAAEAALDVTANSFDNMGSQTGQPGEYKKMQSTFFSRRKEEQSQWSRYPALRYILSRFSDVSESPLMHSWETKSGKQQPALTQWLIFISGINAGIMTVEDMSDTLRNRLELMEQIILWCFTLECVLEFLGSGAYIPQDTIERDNQGQQQEGGGEAVNSRSAQRTQQEGMKWGNSSKGVYEPNLLSYFESKWNIFDLLVVVLCHAFGKSFQSVRLLRLLRIIETNKAMRVLVAGLIDGGKFIFSICVLLSLVFYVFAVIGTYAFKENDPEHFASLDLSMLSLFRVATLEDWTDIMYINMYGCDKYGYDQHMSVCTKPQSQLYFAPVYFSIVVFIGNMIYMNLFVAVVTTAMTCATDMSTGKPEVTENETEASIGIEDAEFLQWVLKHRVYQEPAVPGLSHYAMQIKSFTQSNTFLYFLGFAIILAGVSSGIQSHALEGDFLDFMHVVDYVVIICFGLEFLVKVSAEGTRPWKYWTGRNWKWNTFDFFVLVTCLIPSSRVFGGVMRLLSLAKLVTTIPTLNIIMDGLIAGVNNMLYTLLLLLLVFYIFSIQGILMFRDNDPWHFHSLPIAYITLLRSCTGDDWTDLMYINMYGCDRYPYGDSYAPGVAYQYVTGERCDNPDPQGLYAVVFFLLFMVVVSLVMVNLFVGVVTSGISQVMERFKKHEEDAIKLGVVVKMFRIDRQMLQAYIQLFQISDSCHEKDGSLSHTEVLHIYQTTFTESEVKSLISAVDIDKSGFLDISEFAILMHVTQIMKAAKTLEEAHDTCRRSLLTLSKEPLSMSTNSKGGSYFKRMVTSSEPTLEDNVAHEQAKEHFTAVMNKILEVLSDIDTMASNGVEKVENVVEFKESSPTKVIAKVSYETSGASITSHKDRKASALMPLDVERRSIDVVGKDEQPCLPGGI